MPMVNGEVPTEMSRSDRRIIFAKLEEVYQDEEIGYRNPWTDVTVARDLGSHIPVAWVAQVREENFGPAKDNGEIRGMLTRVEAEAVEARKILAECKTIRIEASNLVERINGLMKRATESGKSLDGLIAIASRIERSVS